VFWDSVTGKSGYCQLKIIDHSVFSVGTTDFGLISSNSLAATDVSLGQSDLTLHYRYITEDQTEIRFEWRVGFESEDSHYVRPRLRIAASKPIFVKSVTMLSLEASMLVRAAGSVQGSPHQLDTCFASVESPLGFVAPIGQVSTRTTFNYLVAIQA
jgi:hypothetical protein